MDISSNARNVDNNGHEVYTTRTNGIKKQKSISTCQNTSEYMYLEWANEFHLHLSTRPGNTYTVIGTIIEGNEVFRNAFQIAHVEWYIKKRIFKKSG